MTTSFPTSLDSYTAIQSNDSQETLDHAGLHTNVQDAIEAMQAKMGANSSGITSSIDYQINNSLLGGNILKTGSSTTIKNTLDISPTTGSPIIALKSIDGSDPIIQMYDDSDIRRVQSYYDISIHAQRHYMYNAAGASQGEIYRVLPDLFNINPANLDIDFVAEVINGNALNIDSSANRIFINDGNNNIDFSIETVGGLCLLSNAGSNILHLGGVSGADIDTYINVTNGYAVQFNAGANLVHFNPANNDIDFRIDSATADNVFNVDGGTGQVSVNAGGADVNFVAKTLNGVAMQVDAGSNLVWFNVDNADIDFRVDTVATDNAFLLNAGANTATFNVPVTMSDDLFVTDRVTVRGSWATLRLAVDTITDPTIIFEDESNADDWTIRMDVSDNKEMEWRWNNAKRMELFTDGKLLVDGTHIGLGGTVNRGIEYDSVLGAVILQNASSSTHSANIHSLGSVYVCLDTNNNSVSKRFEIFNNGDNNTGTPLFTVYDTGSAEVRNGAFYLSQTGGNSLLQQTAYTSGDDVINDWKTDNGWIRWRLYDGAGPYLDLIENFGHGTGVMQRWNLVQNSMSMYTSSVFNAAGEDLDFVIMSDIDSKAFQLDGATGKISMGTMTIVSTSADLTVIKTNNTVWSGSAANMSEASSIRVANNSLVVGSAAGLFFSTRASSAASGAIVQKLKGSNSADLHYITEGGYHYFEGNLGGGVLRVKDTGGAGGSANPWIGFYDSTNSRQGYVGFGSTGNDDIYLVADSGNVNLVPDSGKQVYSARRHEFAGQIHLKNTSNQVIFEQNDAGDNEKMWTWLNGSSAGTIELWANDDLGAFVQAALQITRTGTNVDSFIVNADTLVLNGNEVKTKNQFLITSTGRWYCNIDNSWVTDSDDNYGITYYQYNEASGTGATPIMEWEHMGYYVPAGTKINKLTIIGRCTNLEVTDMEFYAVFKQPDPITRWESGIDSDAEMSATVLFNDLFFTPTGGGTAFTGSLNDNHKREMDIDFVVPTGGGYLSIYARPVGTIVAVRHFPCSTTWECEHSSN